jgi:hypothetical protein
VGLRIGCLYNANIHRKPSCAAKLTHLIDNLKSKNNGLVWDEVRWHGSLRISNTRNLGVLRGYHNSIRNERKAAWISLSSEGFLDFYHVHCNQPKHQMFQSLADCSPLELFTTRIPKLSSSKQKKNFAILLSLFSRPVLGVSQHCIFRTGRLGWSFIYN